MSSFSFYKNVTLLDTRQHRNLRFKPFADVRFASTAQSAMLAASEIPDCAIEYPIVFAPTRDGPVAVALFGLRQGENLFVTAEGKWEGRYVPAFLRRYPFLPATAPNGSVMIAIDDTCTNLGETEGELLIDGEGNVAPYLGEMLKFIGTVHADYSRASAFAKSLAERGLLREMNAEIKLESGEKFAVTGFLVVDEAKISALPDDELAKMARNGELVLIHAHLLSIRNLQKLLSMMQGRLVRPATDTRH